MTETLFTNPFIARELTRRIADRRYFEMQERNRLLAKRRHYFRLAHLDAEEKKTPPTE